MLKIAAKTQQMIFESEVLPSLFHSTPDQFFHYLERDGTKFLNFYWHEAGEKIDPSLHNNAFGLNYVIRNPTNRTSMALISLPEPCRELEAYFVALIHRPLRIIPFSFISDTTKVVALEYGGEGPGGAQSMLVEWTKRLAREKLGPPGQPLNLEGFYKEVKELLRTQ
jgi:hypothetical protein